MKMSNTTTFDNKMRQPFDIQHLETPHLPAWTEYVELFPEGRLLNYLVKSPLDDTFRFGAIKDDKLQSLICSLWEKSELMKDRYCFVTIDNGPVAVNETQRTPGWHIDGLQGKEVKHKQLPDIQYIWCNCLPTLFTSQSFDIEGVNVHTHNIFRHLEKQINPDMVVETEPFILYQMSPYHAHRSQVAGRDYTNRSFVRISFSFIPVTNRAMTVNETISYPYRYHTTDGKIPGELI